MGFLMHVCKAVVQPLQARWDSSSHAGLTACHSRQLHLSQSRQWNVPAKKMMKNEVLKNCQPQYPELLLRM